MKTSLIYFIVIYLTSIASIAQTSESSESLISVEQLNFMKGSWKGNGWIMKNRVRQEFIQEENISSRVDDSILVIDGLGRAKDSTIIHNAFGVISFNENEKMITMLSFSEAGGKMERQLELTGNKKLEWSFKDERGGTIRFKEDFSIDGLWIEEGEYSSDGEIWYPFFQMTLKKLSN